MNKEDRAILVACSIGDGYINVRNRLKDGKYKYESSEIRIVHNRKQKEYCHYKAELIRKILGGSFRVIDFVHAPPSMNGKSFQCTGFSCSNKYWKQIKGWLYNNKKKVITKQILDMLTPKALAIWFMDDGSTHCHKSINNKITSGSVEIATMCSKEEAELIIKWFLDNYGIQWKLRFDKKCSPGNEYFIQANTKEARKFLSLIVEHAIPSMMYKFSLINDLFSTSAEH